MSNSAKTLYPLVAIPALIPFLIRPAAASVGEPLICNIPPESLETPYASRWRIRDEAIALPIPSLSKDT